MPGPNELSPKLGTSALREILPNTCQVGSTFQSRPAFGDQILNSVAPEASPSLRMRSCRLRVAYRNCVPAIARRSAGSKSCLPHRARCFSSVNRGRQQRALCSADIGELLVVDAAVQDVDAGDQAVAEAADETVVGDLGKPP